MQTCCSWTVAAWRGGSLACGAAACIAARVGPALTHAAHIIGRPARRLTALPPTAHGSRLTEYGMRITDHDPLDPSGRPRQHRPPPRPAGRRAPQPLRIDPLCPPAVAAAVRSPPPRHGWSSRGLDHQVCVRHPVLRAPSADICPALQASSSATVLSARRVCSSPTPPASSRLTMSRQSLRTTLPASLSMRATSPLASGTRPAKRITTACVRCRTRRPTSFSYASASCPRRRSRMCAASGGPSSPTMRPTRPASSSAPSSTCATTPLRARVSASAAWRLSPIPRAPSSPVTSPPRPTSSAPP